MRGKLLLQQACVTGNALPLSEIKNPCVREAAHVIIRLALVSSLGVIDPGHNRSVAEEVHFDILDRRESGLEPRIFNVGQEPLLVAELAIPLRVYETAGNERIEGGGVTIHLSFVPEALKDKKLAFARISLLGGEPDRKSSQQETAENCTDHALTRSPASPREATVNNDTVRRSSRQPKRATQHYERHACECHLSRAESYD